MLIECTVQRAEPVVVSIGNETYHFDPDAQGRKVAEVWIESHIESFLAVSHLYREAKPAQDDHADTPKPAEPEAKPAAKTASKPVGKPAKSAA